MNQRIVVRELEPSDRDVFAKVAAGALVRSRAFMHRRMWSMAIIVVGEPGTKARVTSRADFAMWLRANGLDELAREVVGRRVGPHEILIFVFSEPDFLFAMLNLAGAFG